MAKFTCIDRDLQKRAEAADCAIQAPGDRDAHLAAADKIMAAGRMAAPCRRGRGAALNSTGRFEKIAAEAFAAGPESGAAENLKTQVRIEKPHHIISRNIVPDIPYSQSVNPYRGCEHGCIYCYARPSHAYMGLSAGLDFESRLFAKPEAARLLRKELAHPAYRPELIALAAIRILISL